MMLEAVRSIIASRAAAKLEAGIASDALRISMAESGMGEANIQPMRNLAAIRQFISSRSLFALIDLPFAPLFIGILYIIHPTLFWLTVAGAVLLFLIAILNQRLTKRASVEAGQAQTVAMTMALIYTKPVLVPFVLAMFIYTSATPLVDWFEDRLKAPRLAAVGVTFLFIFLCFSLCITLIGSSLSVFFEGASAYKEKIISMVRSLMGVTVGSR